MRGHRRAVWLSVSLFALAVSARAETLVIKGSNTFGEELGPRLIEAFRAQRPGVEVILERKGTATGIAALLAGECDIASASRTMNEDELRLARSRGIRTRTYLVGFYAVSVVVNAGNPVGELTDRQVREIFTGRSTRWSAVGGRDAAIRVCIRDARSGTHLGFRELAMGNEPYTPAAETFESYEAIAAAVRADVDAIGYVGMNYAAMSGIKPVLINGIRPSILAVNEGLYPYARAVRFYTNAARETPVTRAFIRFVQSRDGQRIVQEMGFAPRFERSLLRRTEAW
ncbi:MAG: phosphate ABC transporter substrate-binding protein [Verrucomicrobiae bacterium]|nr:phosphate ABC transporter substrate-binding protein [Verrucomicrobiae bacterium]